MIVIRNAQATFQINDPDIRDFVQQRISDLGGPAFDPDTLGYFLVFEAGDTADAAQEHLGFNLLHNRYSGFRYDQTGYTPSFEVVEEFATCYDMVFILSDDGFGIELFIPKDEHIDADIIALCCKFAFKAEVQLPP